MFNWKNVLTSYVVMKKSKPICYHINFFSLTNVLRLYKRLTLGEFGWRLVRTLYYLCDFLITDLKIFQNQVIQIAFMIFFVVFRLKAWFTYKKLWYVNWLKDKYIPMKPPQFMPWTHLFSLKRYFCFLYYYFVIRTHVRSTFPAGFVTTQFSITN